MIAREIPTDASLEEYDRTYREGGLRAMASAHVHYHNPVRPCPGCGHRMEWVDFMREAHRDKTNVYDPLARSFWEGTGFAGRCPSCGGWIRFTSLAMHALDDDEAAHLPQLPDNWHAVAQFA